MAKRIELSSLITEASIKDPLLQQVIRLQRTATRLFKNTADNINIPPRDRSGLLNAFKLGFLDSFIKYDVLSSFFL